MKALIKYHAGAYITSAKFVMPMLIYFLFLVGYYCNAPKTVVASFTISTAVLYIIMVWAGFVFSDSEEAVAEQILILKSKSIKTYYTSKIVFLFFFGAFMSIMGMVVPAIFQAGYSVAGSTLFDAEENLNVIAIVIGYLIHVLGAFLGASLGFLFHPRIFRNRKVTVIIAMLIGVMGFLKGPVVEDFAASRFFAWIFPPIYDLMSACGEAKTSNVFPINQMIVPMVIMVVYSLIVSILCVTTVKKKGF